MVDFKTRIYTESEDDIIGAEVLVYSDNGDRIGSIEIVNAEDLNDLREQLSVIDETYFTESRLNAILANAQETTNINATELSGFASSDFAKVTQLSNYALSNHTHVKTNISDLYNYSISCSDYNPTIDSEISVTVKVTNQAGNPVSGQSVSIAKNNVSWKNGVTGSNGEFTTTYTCSEWGLVTFSANNSFKQITIQGWREVTLPSSVTSYCNLYVNEALRICDFKYYRTDYNFTTTSSITLHTNLIPQVYRPIVNVISASFNELITAGIITDGSLSVASSSTGSKNINISAMWHY